MHADWHAMKAVYDERQFDTVMEQKQFSGDIRFRLSCTEFPGNISAILLGFEKQFHSWNLSEIFYVWMDN